MIGFKYSNDLTSEVKRNENLFSEVEHAEPINVVMVLNELIQNAQSDVDKYNLYEVKRQFIEMKNYIKNLQEEILKSFAVND